MANLITEKQKKELRNDYIIRLITVILVLISLLGVLLLAYIIPYYISICKKDLQVAEQFENVINLENKENIGESMTFIVNQTLDKMKAVELYSKNYKPSTYFTKIVESKNRGIKIIKLSFNYTKDNELSFLVNGIAEDRESLVIFADNLKAQTSFTSVDFPVADLAKDDDIDFTLNIVTKI